MLLTSDNATCPKLGQYPAARGHVSAYPGRSQIANGGTTTALDRDAGKRKAGRSWEGDLRAPGLTIDRMVVPRRA
jgi:hypothetical protein